MWEIKLSKFSIKNPMKQPFIILLISIIMLSSCDNKKDDMESNKYIPREKMILVLADMQITESYLESLKKTGRRMNDTTLLYYEKVFKKHQISPAEFEESLLWYKKDYEDLDLLYTEVITRLSELKAKNEELMLQMKADSIRADSMLRAEFISDSIQNHVDSLKTLEIEVLDSITIE